MSWVKETFRKINDATNNVLGLDWTDPHNMDDIIAQNGELHVVVRQACKTADRLTRCDT